MSDATTEQTSEPDEATAGDPMAEDTASDGPDVNDPGVSDPGADDPTNPFRQARLHGDMLTTTLLALLKGYDTHGYDLLQRLSAAGLPPFDPGAVYRALRQLETTGLVSSFWDTSAKGPARRMYSLTRGGELFLTSWMGVMQVYQDVLNHAATTMQPAARSQDD